MSIERYRSVMVTDETLALMVGSSTRVAVGPDMEIDVNLTAPALKAELDAFMADAGFVSVVTDPTTPLPIIALEWQGAVIDNTINTPPVGPSTGDRYIVAAGGTGAWSGRDDDIAVWNGTAWVFTVPSEGFFAYVLSQNSLFYFDSTSTWTAFASGGTERQESVTTQTITNTDTTLTDTLDFEPRDPDSVLLMLNGVVQVQGATRDYLLTGATNQSIEWRALSGSAVNMTTTDELIAYYVSA